MRIEVVHFLKFLRVKFHKWRIKDKKEFKYKKAQFQHPNSLLKTRLKQKKSNDTQAKSIKGISLFFILRLLIEFHVIGIYITAFLPFQFSLTRKSTLTRKLLKDSRVRRFDRPVFMTSLIKNFSNY